MELSAFIEKVRRRESLAGHDLTGVDPFAMDLGGIDLKGADLSREHVPVAAGGTYWPSSSDSARRMRRRVRLRGADLGGANLDRILGEFGDLRGAHLRDASLVEADLRHADLTLADLSGADLTGANLQGAMMAGAKWDDMTRWPEEFTP